MMRFVLFGLFAFATNALACRTAQNFHYDSPREAYASADRILSGRILRGERSSDPNKAFEHRYTIAVDRTWKGPPAPAEFSFTLEQHSCAKFRSEFSASPSVHVFYFKGSELLRVGSAAEDLPVVQSHER